SLSAFFFRAEDGIRGFHVTGVQTCALPISARPADASAKSSSPRGRPGPLVISARDAFAGADGLHACTPRNWIRRTGVFTVRSGRSEERRVGKACRCRG